MLANLREVVRGGQSDDILIFEKYHEQGSVGTLREDSFTPEPWDRRRPSRAGLAFAALRVTRRYPLRDQSL
jgi:hypothetical protein